MRRGTVAMIFVAVGLVVAGAAFALLQTTSGGPTMLSSDVSCRGSNIGLKGAPRGEPERTLELPVHEGSTFTLSLPAGEWVARIHAEGATFARMVMNTPESPQSDLTRGWCHGQDMQERYAIAGNGTITVHYWTGDAGGLTIR